MPFINNDLFAMYSYLDITFLDEVYSGKRKKLYKLGHYIYFPLTNNKINVLGKVEPQTVMN
jgi:hypothetical protein